MSYPLPYTFARTHQLLLQEQSGQHSLWVHAHTAPSAVSEVMRKYPVEVMETLEAEGRCRKEGRERGRYRHVEFVFGIRRKYK